MKKKHHEKPLPEGALISQPFKPKSRFKLPKLSKKYRVPALVVIVIVLLGGGYATYKVINKPTDQKPPLVLPEGVERNYHTAPVDFLPKMLDYDYDLTVQDIEKGNLSKIIKDFDMGYNIATMLNRLNKPDQALEAYRVAATKANNDSGFTFYLEYCRFAFGAKKTDLGNKICDQAADKVKKSNLPESDKSAWLFSINSIKNPIPEDNDE